MWQVSEQKIEVRQLQVGMYVCRLDLPWSDTDYLLQGLKIKNRVDISKLTSYCQYVYIDVNKSSLQKTALKVSRIPPKVSANKTHNAKRKPLTFHPARDNWVKKHSVEHYAVSTQTKSEIKTALPVFNDIEHQVSKLLERMTHNRSVNIEELVDRTSDMVESIIRNPDAFAWLSRIRENRAPIYLHTVRLAVWGGIVGRQLGLNRFSLTHLTMTLLMTGIGKSLQDEYTLMKYKRERPSMEYQSHVNETIYHLSQFHFSCESILQTLQNYCERYDGSGFPAGIKGNAIPFLSRVAGLIETFELMINPYNPVKAISPANAIAKLNALKDVQFDGSLVEEFIKAVGLYPTGSLVELNNGAIGVIFTQSYEKRLRASVIPLTHDKGQRYTSFKILDLGYNAEEGESLHIKRGVASNHVPVSVLNKAHEYIFNRRQKPWSRVRDLIL